MSVCLSDLTEVVWNYTLGPVKDQESNPSPGRFGILPQKQKTSLWACHDSESMSYLLRVSFERERESGTLKGPSAVNPSELLGLGLLPRPLRGLFGIFLRSATGAKKDEEDTTERRNRYKMRDHADHLSICVPFAKSHADMVQLLDSE